MSVDCDWLNQYPSTKLTANGNQGIGKRKRDEGNESEYQDYSKLTKKQRGGHNVLYIVIDIYSGILFLGAKAPLELAQVTIKPPPVSQ